MCKSKSDDEIKKTLKWVRAGRHFKYNDKNNKEQPAVLFDIVQPGDIAQGSLGDCWLLAALASLAEFPESIRRCFITATKSARGKYVVQLYDARKKTWVKITVDDFYPLTAKDDEPVFCVPKLGELWVLIMEKAFAKFCNGYSNLDGGSSAWAMEALTGDNVFMIMKDDENAGSWKRINIAYEDDKKKWNKNPRKDYWFTNNKERFDDNYVWNLLVKYDKSDALVSASRSNKGEEKRSDGIVAGHAYSLLIAHEVSVGWPMKKKVRLLQLRNPWGTFEWKGDWSKNSELWAKNPKVLKEIKKHDNAEGEEGVFWMCWDDFSKTFNKLQICDRSFCEDTLKLNEKDGAMGLCGACVKGCAHHWLCCGLCGLYFGHQGSSETAKVKGSACPCFGKSKKEAGKKWEAK